MVLNRKLSHHKNIQLILLYINDLLDDIICNIAIYADDTTLYYNCDQASDLWEQLEWASELEPDLQDTAQQTFLVFQDVLKTS